MTSTSDPAPRKRLLFVEDDRDNRETLAMILEQKYDVFGYPSAEDAMQAIYDVQPDLLLLDIGMYPVDGLECLRSIRAIPRYRTTPAVALTAHARGADRKKFIEGGFQAVVVKPVLDPLQLIGRIDELLLGASALDARQIVTKTSAPRSRGPYEGAPT
jgi:CheY-like chemotaxis protein